MAILLAFDSDEFNRYEAAQNLATKMIDELVGNSDFKVSSVYLDAIGALIKDNTIDPAFKALALELPAEEVLFQRYRPLDPSLVAVARDSLESQIAKRYESEILALYNELKPKTNEYKLDPVSVGNRALRNLCLSYLATTNIHNDLIQAHYKSATNMTDEIAGLKLLMNCDSTLAKTATDDFYRKWRKETLVMQKWLGVQATASSAGALGRVKALEQSDVYDINVPNLVRSLLLSFTRNYRHFHAANGDGYSFIGEKILVLDKINPQVASRLMSSYKDFKKLTPELQSKMKPVLEKIAATEGLSKNTYEVVTKTLNS